MKSTWLTAPAPIVWRNTKVWNRHGWRVWHNF